MAGIFKSLDKSDVRITPFRTYKLWADTIQNNLSGSVYTVYQANYNPLPNYQEANILNDNFDQGNFHYERDELTTANGKYQRVVHRSVEHLYYRDFYTNNKASFGSGNINSQYRYLEDQAQVISMPQSRFGEAILPGSIHMTVSWSMVSGSTSTHISGTWIVEDDLYGNLIISGGQYLSPYGQYVGGAFTNYTSSVSKQPVGEWPIDEIYKYAGAGAVNFSSSYNRGGWNVQTNYNNVQSNFVTASSYLTGSEKGFLGTALYFTSSLSSSITVGYDPVPDYKEGYNFQNKDYTITMMVMPTQAPTNPSGAVLLAKHGYAEELRVDENGNVYSQPVNNQFPYRIAYTTESKVAFEKGGGADGTYGVTSSFALQSNQLYYIIAEKSGSNMTLEVYGSASYSATSGSCPFSDKDCINLSNIHIGNSYRRDQAFSGMIDNIKIYRETLNTNEKNILRHTQGVGTTQVGNVFYNHGMMALTSIPSRYASIHEIDTRGTHTIWETEVSCTVGPGEFTRSNNPTMQEYSPKQNQFVFKSFVTGSDFVPFVTTIGLYDDYHRLVAIGKLSTPIQMPNNVDTTFIVRFDR
jgi:hypothetical protein